MNRRVTPVFGGYQFEIQFLRDESGTEVKWYGYNIKGNGRQEAGGAYKSIEAATRACLARIETLAFDGKIV